MKSEILKIAGVKNESEFYKKFPTKEAFMKIHGKEFKKAKLGKSIQSKNLNQLVNFTNDPDRNVIPFAQSGINVSNPVGFFQGISQFPIPPIPQFNLPTNPSSLVGMQGYDLPEDLQMGIETDEMNLDKFQNMSPEKELMNSGIGKGLFSSVNEGSVNFPKPPGVLEKAGGVGALAGAASDIVGGIRQIGEDKRELKRTRQQKRVSDVMTQAASSRDISPIKRRYSRPEDVIFSPEQLYPSYGTGTNILSMRKGGEIKNTYVPPTTLYTDLEEIPQGKFGLSEFASQGGADIAGQLGMYASGGPSGEGKIGGALGSVAGSIVGGPIGGMIGKGLGSLVGGLFGANRRSEMKRLRQGIDTNVATITGQAIPQQFNQYMKNGGEVSDYEWISHTWQPQKIVKFGDHYVSDLLKPDKTMDTLRTGGNLRQNEIYPQDQFSLGGELQTTWGGYAEPISQNPYLPGSGQTVMFRGNSHDESDGKGRTGIGVKYGADGINVPFGQHGVEQHTDVEVERGEPATELIDPETGENNMVVFGNLKIPNMFAEQLGKDAKGRKFKNYVNDLSKKEARQNKILEKASLLANDADDITSMGKLQLSSAKASMIGADMKLKKIADLKNKAALAQSAINDTAEEYGLDADLLAKGKVKLDKETAREYAMFGKQIKKAQRGITQLGRDAQGFPLISIDETDQSQTSSKKLFKDVSDIANYYKQYGYDGGENIEDLQKWIAEKATSDNRVKNEMITYLKQSDIPLTNYGKKKYKGKSKNQLSDDQLIDQFVDGLWDYRFPKLQSIPTLSPVQERATIPASKPKVQIKPSEPVTEVAPVQAKKRSPYIDAFNQLLPFIRPSDAEPLDFRQLYGEMATMADPLEPVPAQLYQPQLKSIYDISLQDQLNEITAQSRAAERMSQFNPAAAASLMGAASRERSKVLGEQTRMNQANMAGIIGDNINTINDSRLKNLQILDQQYQRQEQAKSNTKASRFAALQSMGDKYLKNQLNNRTLQTYENMYNYRFDPQFRAVNMNPLFQANIPQVGEYASTEKGGLPEVPGYEWDTTPSLKKKKKESKESRNGSIVKALKRI